MNLPLHAETTAEVAAAAEAVFARLDDQRNLGAHMSRSSWMMAGSSMEYVFDAAEGRVVGAKIGLRGKILGVPLSVDAVVVERVPPTRKVWETIGPPKLFVIGPYRMGYEIRSSGETSRLRMFIDYERSANPLGQLFGDTTPSGAPRRWSPLRRSISRPTTR